MMETDDKYGRKLNTSKTSFVVISKKPIQQIKYRVYAVRLEKFNKTSYLSANLNDNWAYK